MSSCVNETSVDMVVANNINRGSYVLLHGIMCVWKARR